MEPLCQEKMDPTVLFLDKNRRKAQDSGTTIQCEEVIQ